MDYKQIVKAGDRIGFPLVATKETVKPISPPLPFEPAQNRKGIYVEINYSGYKFGFSFHPNKVDSNYIKKAQKTLLALGYRPEKHQKSGYTLVMTTHNQGTALKTAKAFKELVDKAGEVFGGK